MVILKNNYQHRIIPAGKLQNRNIDILSCFFISFNVDHILKVSSLFLPLISSISCNEFYDFYFYILHNYKAALYVCAVLSKILLILNSLYFKQVLLIPDSQRDVLVTKIAPIFCFKNLQSSCLNSAVNRSVYMDKRHSNLP